MRLAEREADLILRRPFPTLCASLSPQDNVRGISLKLQEEERERRMDFVPAESAINPSSLVVDPDTKEMLNHLGMGTVAVKVEDVKREEVRPQRFGGPRRDAPPGGR